MHVMDMVVVWLSSTTRLICVLYLSLWLVIVLIVILEIREMEQDMSDGGTFLVNRGNKFIVTHS